jgi:hypothetical protein
MNLSNIIPVNPYIRVISDVAQALRCNQNELSTNSSPCSLNKQLDTNVPVDIVHEYIARVVLEQSVLQVLEILTTHQDTELVIP